MGSYEGSDTLEMVETVRFEACAGFRASDEDEFVCSCGWLEPDHGEQDQFEPAGELAAARVARRQRRPRPVVLPERRAS